MNAQTLLPFGSGIGSGLAILIGGAIALRFLLRLKLILGLSAGTVIGVALFELLPEAFRLDAGFFPVEALLGFLALGFCLYLLLDRVLHRVGMQGGHLGPASLLLHSLFDGFMVGIGFHISVTVGLVLGFAVFAHGLAHGVNTVALSVSSDGSDHFTRRWLMTNAVGPLTGVVLAQFFSLPPTALAATLSIFAGVFLFIGTSELLPVRQNRSLQTVAATVFGVIVMYGLVTLLGGNH